MRFAVIAFLLFMGLCVRAVPRVEIPPQGIAFGEITAGVEVKGE